MKEFYLDDPHNVLSAITGYREWVWIASSNGLGGWYWGVILNDSSI